MLQNHVLIRRISLPIASRIYGCHVSSKKLDICRWTAALTRPAPRHNVFQYAANASYCRHGGHIASNHTKFQAQRDDGLPEDSLRDRSDSTLKVETFRSSFFPDDNEPTIHDLSRRRVASQDPAELGTDEFSTSESEILTDTRFSRIESYLTSEGRPWANFRRKTDLSYVNVRSREAASIDGIKMTGQPSNTPFRTNARLRYILYQFISHIPLDTVGELTAFLDETQEGGEKLLRIVTPEIDKYLRSRGYRAADLVSWAWVFSHSSSTRQIQRYIALARDCRKRSHKQPPIFLPLQLLRHDRISADSLRALWMEITENFEGAEDIWDETSASILLIRAVRHGRKVDVGLYQDLASFAPKVYPYRHHELQDEQQIMHVRRVTHFYNRLLTLLALPTPRQPFNSVVIQQNAQLDIARFMYHCQPPVVINREGYRAFVQLQLRHAKTTAEGEWARVKSPSWPPWRRDQLGIQETMEYPGRHSRVIKVLQRMQESGYGPTDFEQNAQILAGWDTDKSPTIQVRRLMHIRPMTWLRQLFVAKDSDRPVIDHNMWTARVEATRTVREAWLCFHSYLETTRESKRSFAVYRAMFQKLLARALPSDALSETLPGDGLEVFSDPISSRDLVYVPSEPPSPDELYAQMLQDDIKPGGRLLGDLLNAAPSPDHVHRYISDSMLSETKRDVLLHAERYPYSVIRTTIQQIPDYIISSFLVGLSGGDGKCDVTFQKPGSLSTESRNSGQTVVSLPSTYARQLLDICEIRHLPAYHAILTGLQRRSTIILRKTKISPFALKRAVVEVWDETVRVIEAMNRRQQVPNPTTLRTVALIVQNLMSLEVQDDSNLNRSMSETLKCLFWFVLTGRSISEHDWQQRSKFASLRMIPASSIVSGVVPGYKELEVLFLTFSTLSDQEAIMSLLAWVSAGEEQNVFTTQRARHQKQMMSAVRVALEGTWNLQEGKDSHLQPATDDQMSEAIDFCARLGWASDKETEELLRRRRIWIDSIRRDGQSRIREIG